MGERFDLNIHLIDPNSERSQIVHLNRCKLSPHSREINDDELTVSPQSSPSSGELQGFDEQSPADNFQLQQVDETEVRRSGRLRRDPDRYGDVEVYWHNRGSRRREVEFPKLYFE